MDFEAVGVTETVAEAGVCRGGGGMRHHQGAQQGGGGGGGEHQHTRVYVSVCVEAGGVVGTSTHLTVT
jgi:hypothetical protein